MSKAPAKVDRRTFVTMTGAAAAAIGLGGAAVFSELLFTDQKGSIALLPGYPEERLPPLPTATLLRARSYIRAIVRRYGNVDTPPQIVPKKKTAATPSTMTVEEIRAKHGEFAARMKASFIAMNTETDHYRTYGPALLALPIERWDAALTSEHPEWNCVGALEHLKDAATEMAAADGARAQAILSFVRTRLSTVPTPVNGEFMLAALPSKVHLAYARVLFTTNRYEAALDEIEQGIKAVRAATLVWRDDEAKFEMLRAIVHTKTGHHEEALLDYLSSGLYFADTGASGRMVESLCGAAIILCTHGAFETAAPALTLAGEIADGSPEEDGRCKYPSEKFTYALNRCVALGYLLPRRA